MRPTRPLAVGAALALAACSPDLPTTAAKGDGHAPASAMSAAAAPVCVEFGPPPPFGAVWGVPASTPPGSLIFVENGIPVYIDKLFLSLSSTVYNYARIGTSPVPIGSGQQIYLDQVNLRFDFSGVPFPISSVTWEWYDPGAGGTLENMAVNGGPIFIGDIIAPAAVSGQPYSVGWGAAGTGRRGRSAIRGPIGPMLLGGQKIWIDRVCANP